MAQLFQKRHYEAIASLIAEWAEDNDQDIEDFPILSFFRSSMADQFIRLFEQDNQKFNREKFRKATKTEEYK